MKKLILFLLLFFLFTSIMSFGQQEPIKLKAETGTLRFLGISQPISSLKEFPFPERHDFERNEEMKDRLYPFAESALPKGIDPVVQKYMGENYDSKGLTVNYDGMSNTGYPPDPNGDVGPNHYFQTINTQYQIFDKAGNSLYGPADIRNFWGITEGVSDPVVLYDDNADRWFVEIFTTTPNPGGPFNIKFAISQTGNPLGSYYLYTLAGLPNLPDFTKFGVWRDGYYMSANSGSYDVYAFDRSAMIAGAPTGFVRFDNAWRPLSGFHCIMPLENDGAFAPSGTPGQFITINDDAWGGNDELWIYELNVDWNNTGAATFTRTQQITVASFDSNFGPGEDNIYQQGTSQRIDAVPQVLNYRAQYRNFGTHQTIVCNHSVDIDNTDHAGVRWYELRDTGGSWWLYQQSTYAPDAHSRWMGAIAMNAYGDIGLAYSVSSSSLYPGLRYTGRHASDPLGTMTFAEQSIWDGTNSQTYGNRWGDYYSMSVDPSDNRTFWFTGEYHGTNRRTRIAAIDFGVYCAASGGCDEYISDVFFGSINNSSGCTYYGDYTAISTDLPLNGAEFLTIHNGKPIYNVDECGVWVDWDNNGIFDIPSEEIMISGSPGAGPYTATIIPPAGTTTGLKTMRIRIDYDTPPLPCGIATWGEVEDYTINVTPKVPAIWTGAFDENWHNADNWSTPSIPDATTDVIIPATTTKCWVWAGPAFCKNITIEYGSGYTLRIWDQYLDISGNMNIYGQLLMDHEDGSIDAHGDIIWESGSSASIQANTIIELSGDWIFKSGANVELNNGQVAITGSGNSYIRTFEDNCYFNHLVVYKTGANWASIGSTNTADMHIHGDLINQVNSHLYIYTPESVLVQGNLLNFETLMAYDGNVILNGDAQMIFGDAADPPSVFNDLTINSTSSTTISSNGIEVSGDLTIEHGELLSQGYTISVGGNWNNLGPGAGAAFFADTGRVIFNGGNYHQYCSDEFFNILEVDKPLGGAFRMEGTHVLCAAYDWTAGAIDVIPGGGSFTAFDLMDDGIFGEFYLNPGGTISLTNNDGYVDLNGELHILGGEMHVFGGTTYSYWPYAADALISMYDGILDFHDQGIFIHDSPTYTLTESIAGGTIRTAWGFMGNSPDFSPDYGIMEFYSSNDADIYTDNGCYLNDVTINKGTKDNSITKSSDAVKSVPVIDERSGKTISNGSKSNALRITKFLDINGNLLIESGALDANGFNIQIDGDWLNFVGDAGFIESTGWVTFDDDDNVGSIIHTNETFNNLMLLSTVSGIPGLTILDGVEVNITNSLDLQLSSLNMGFASMINVGGDIFIADEAGLNADDGDNLITIGGNWTNENDPSTMFEGFWPGGETVIFDGFTDQTINVAAPEETFTNLVINKTSGEFKPNDNIQVLGNLNIRYGDWRDNVPLLSHNFYGDFIIDIDGNYYPEYETCFKGESDQVYETFGGDGIFKKLVIDKTPAKNSFGYKGGGSKSMTLTINSDMVVHDGYGTSIEEGNFFLNGHLFNPTSHMYMEDGSALIVNEGATLVLSSGLFMNGGEFISYGSPGNEATVTKGAFGEYQFEVRSGASISSNFTLFEGMNGNGIWVQYGAFVDPVNAFNNCIFGTGDNLSGSIRLTINNDQNLNLDNVSFIDNPYVTGSINVGKYYNWGELEFTNFSGDFSGQDYEDDIHNRIHWIPSEHRLELKVFLEGPFNGTYMSPALNAVLPLNSPFNPPLPYFGNPMPDWYYASGGSVGFIPNTSVVDWVLVQLRDASSASAALPATNIATTPAFVMDDGSIITLDGSSQLSFDVTPLNNLYVAIWHRNHLGVISANPLTEIEGIYPYDFTTSASQVYGGSSAQVQLSSVPEIWGMMAGDGDGNGVVGDPDKLNIWNFQTGTEGYLESDFNLNKNVNNQDKNDFWYLNYGKATYIPE